MRQTHLTGIWHTLQRKAKKANSQRVPEKQTYPLSYKTFTPQFLLHSAPVQRIHETVRDKSTKKIT